MIAPLRKLKVECPPLLADKDDHRAHVARLGLASGQKLPRYEDVVLGSLGRLGDHLLLFDGERSWRSSRCFGPDGKSANGSARICAISGFRWVTARLRHRARRGAGVTQAVAAGAPVRYRMHRVADGNGRNLRDAGFSDGEPVGSADRRCLCRRSRQPLQSRRYDFCSTDEGIMALAAIRNAAGAAIDFQIVACNEGAGEASGLCRSRNFAAVAAFRASRRDRPRKIYSNLLVGGISSGQFDQFESVFTRATMSARCI